MLSSLHHLQESREVLADNGIAVKIRDIIEYNPTEQEIRDSIDYESARVKHGDIFFGTGWK